MIYGTGHVLAGQLAGWKTIRVKIFPGTLTETQIKLIRLAENLQRENYRA